MEITAINSGIETLMQLGSLGEANYNPAKCLNALSNFSNFVGLLKTLNSIAVFLGNTLEENKARSLLKVSH